MPRYKQFQEKVVAVLESRTQLEDTEFQPHLAKKDINWKHWNEPAWLYRSWNPRSPLHKDTGMFSEVVLYSCHFQLVIFCTERQAGCRPIGLAQYASEPWKDDLLTSTERTQPLVTSITCLRTQKNYIHQAAALSAI
jgi:hypothetical protein